jgi:murein DD-endopeptidase MepM/ murein hydrolase activator NlpD
MRSPVHPALVSVLAILLLSSSGCTREPERPVILRGDLLLEPDTETIPGLVKAGATLGSLLHPHLSESGEVQAVIEAITGVFDVRRLRPQQPWRLERTPDGRLRSFEYEIDPERFLRVAPGGDDEGSFEAAVVPYEVTRQDATVAGRIGDGVSSLFGAMTAAGEGPELALSLAEIFGGEVDFNSDVQPGDAFSALVEKVERDDRFVRYGPVKGASFVNGGRSLVAIRFTAPGGEPGYYDREGRSLKRFFLKSPLKFEPQVTSHFSRARRHPVLHVMRAHLGVDYRAPTGAPVIAVAAGVVTGAGWRGGGGKTVSIRHASGYESFYLHLSAIAPGVRPGVRIAQGQYIGRVGATGLATGPHLDYRLRKNGTFVNQLLEHKRLPPGEPVPAQHLEEFRRVRDEVMSQLEQQGPDVVLARGHDESHDGTR